MTHVDERTLELLALGDERTLRNEDLIRKHLAVCADCSGLYDEIRSYYSEVKLEEGKNVSGARLGRGRALVKRRGQLEQRRRLVDAGVVQFTEVRKPTIWRRVGSQTRAHPVISSTFLMLLAVLVVHAWTEMTARHPNPSYYFYNTKANDLEVYDNSNKLLWSLPAFDISDSKQEENVFDDHQTLLADLNGDGRNEVLTEIAPRSSQFLQNLRIYSNDGKLLKTFAFKSRSVDFRGVSYDTPFLPGQFFVESMSEGKVNLFVTSNDGRSPTFLARLDRGMKVIGKYWHYGNFKAYPTGAYHNGVREVAITGENDIRDMSGGEFDFVAILDPSKIVGDEESSATRGFGVPVSDAELYYIELPISDIQRVQAVGATERILRDSNDSLLCLSVGWGFTDPHVGTWEFEYVFSLKDMKVQQVKFSNPTQDTYEALKIEGKVHGTFDRRYLDNLRNGVRYWNGKEWVKEATRIGGETE